MFGNLPEKKYYSISEVATYFDVNSSLLRFWEKEFKQIKPLIKPLEGYSRPTVNCGYWSAEIWRTNWADEKADDKSCLLYTSPSPRD